MLSHLGFGRYIYIQNYLNKQVIFYLENRKLATAKTQLPQKYLKSTLQL